MKRKRGRYCNKNVQQLLSRSINKSGLNSEEENINFVLPQKSGSFQFWMDIGAMVFNFSRL
jgi:hypothetical protein